MPATDLLLTPLALIIGLVVWGLLPGPCIRVIVKLYPKDHARRKELVAELYAVDLWQRPFWVASQLELACVEGIGLRRAHARLSRLRRLTERWGWDADMRSDGSPVVITVPETFATTRFMSELSELLIKNMGTTPVLLRLRGTAGVRVFEIPYPVKFSNDMHCDLLNLFAQNHNVNLA